MCTQNCCKSVGFTMILMLQLKNIEKPLVFLLFSHSTRLFVVGPHVIQRGTSCDTVAQDTVSHEVVGEGPCIAGFSARSI